MNVQGITRVVSPEELDDYEIEKGKVVYENPKLDDEYLYFNNLSKDCADAIDLLENAKMFTPPCPYDPLTNGKCDHLKWGNLELALLGIAEGYVDGFYIRPALYGYEFTPVKIVDDPSKAAKVREYFIDEFGDWMDKLEEYPFVKNYSVKNPGFRRWLKRDYKNSHNGSRLDDDLWDGWDTTKNSYKMRVLKRVFY